MHSNIQRSIQALKDASQDHKNLKIKYNEMEASRAQIERDHKCSCDQKLDEMKESCDQKFNEIKEAINSLAATRTYADAAAGRLRAETPLTPRKKTWAPVTAQSGTPEQVRVPESTRRERLERLHREKAKTEVLLTLRNASEEAKAKLASTDEKDLTKDLQSAIADIGLEPTKIQGVKKTLNHGLRICCPLN